MSDPPRYRLIPSLGGHETVILAPSEDVIIGRSVRPVDCRSTFYARIDNAKVSKQHAHIALSVDGTVLTITDKSTNGTFIDGAKAPPGNPIQLVSGSVLSFTANKLLHAMLPSFSVMLQEAAPVSASASTPALEVAAEAEASASEPAFTEQSASAHVSALAPVGADRKRNVWSVFDDDDKPSQSPPPQPPTAASSGAGVPVPAAEAPPGDAGGAESDAGGSESDVSLSYDDGQQRAVVEAEAAAAEAAE